MQAVGRRLLLAGHGQPAPPATRRRQQQQQQQQPAAVQAQLGLQAEQPPAARLKFGFHKPPFRSVDHLQ
jgi:hypothetical protein